MHVLDWGRSQSLPRCFYFDFFGQKTEQGKEEEEEERIRFYQSCNSGLEKQKWAADLDPRPFTKAP